MLNSRLLRAELLAGAARGYRNIQTVSKNLKTKSLPRLGLGPSVNLWLNSGPLLERCFMKVCNMRGTVTTELTCKAHGVYQDCRDRPARPHTFTQTPFKAVMHRGTNPTR